MPEQGEIAMNQSARMRRRPRFGLQGLAAGLLLIAAAGAAGAETPPCHTVADAAGLRAVLALPAAEKTGLRVCLRPGRYDMRASDFRGAFTGLDPARPVTFEAADPADPPVLTRWVFASGRDGGENGDAVLRDLVFVLDDVPAVAPGNTGFRGHRYGVVMGQGGITRNVTLERITVRGSLGEARLGAPELERNLTGIAGLRLRNVTIRDARLERLVNGIMVGGTDITVTGNRMRHSWGDFLRVSPQVHGGSCSDTEGVTVTRNMVYDHWANNRLHPDVIHMFASHNVPCAIRGLTIAENLAFPGIGMWQPARPTGVRPRVPGPPPARLPEGHRAFHILQGAGTSELPPADCPEERILIGVQRDGTYDGGGGEPLRLVPRPGDRLAQGRARATEIALVRPWQTVRLTCNPRDTGTWRAFPTLPALQGVFTNALPGPAGFEDVEIRHNILWVTAPAAVSFRDSDDRGIAVMQNSFLQVLPGDHDGDGRANTVLDGANMRFPIGRVILHNGRDMAQHDTVSGGPPDRKSPATMAGNLLLRPRGQDAGRYFAAGPGPALMPTTPAEAVALARPRPGRVPPGVGAVAASEADDPADWSWVAEPW